MSGGPITNRDICDLLRYLECMLSLSAEALEDTGLAEDRYKAAYKARRMYEALSPNPFIQRKHGARLLRSRIATILPNHYRYLRRYNGRLTSARLAFQFAFLRSKSN